MFSSFQDAAFFGFGAFCFVVCFACKIFVVRPCLDCFLVSTRRPSPVLCSMLNTTIAKETG